MKKITISILFLLVVVSCSRQASENLSGTKNLQEISSGDLPVVTGKISIRSKPVAGEILFLGTVLSDPVSGKELAVSLDKSNAPKSVTNSEGVFIFKNLPAGKYGLMLISGMDSFLLLYPKTQDAILLDVSDHNIYDLGLLDYDDLPLE